jgi:hypothetical protein
VRQAHVIAHGKTSLKRLAPGMRHLVPVLFTQRFCQVYHSDKLQNQGYGPEDLERFHDVIIELNRRAVLERVGHLFWPPIVSQISSGIAQGNAQEEDLEKSYDVIIGDLTPYVLLCDSLHLKSHQASLAGS